jgi:glycosyltransferase involved in cell wall biosynthesis
MKSNISVIILTKNEIIHIERSIRNALKLTPYVYVLDSASTDGTQEKAKSLGVKVFQYNWTNSSTFSKKINWGLENIPFKTSWIIRLDADEYFLDNTINNLSDHLEKICPNINAATLNRRIHFKGKWIKNGSQYPRTMVRVLRKGFCHYESRRLDENVIVDQNTIKNLSFDFVDDNLITISKWIKKHDTYAMSEAIEMLHNEIGIFKREESIISGKKAKTNKSIYFKLPMYWRAFFYFFYRYFIKLGFLDGYQGFIWHFFQGWWYRVLVDIKISEINKACGSDVNKIKVYLKKEYNIEL